MQGKVGRADVSAGVPTNEFVEPGSSVFLPGPLGIFACVVVLDALRSSEPCANSIRYRVEDACRVGDQGWRQIRTAMASSQEIVSQGLPLIVHPQIQPRNMAIDDHAVHGSSVTLLDPFDFREERRRVER